MTGNLALIIAILVLVAVFYLIRIMRRVNEKLNKLVASERELRRNIKELELSSRENYRQGEYYSQLLNLLDFKLPIPATRSWAASPDVLLALFQSARATNPKVILDLGSGVSTLVLAKSAPNARIISIDNSEEFAGKTRQMLAQHEIRNVDLRVAPLTPHSSGVDWYELSKFVDITDIDLLFIDGPPGSKNPIARHPALNELIQKLSPNATIIIDDTKRDGEQELAEKIALALPSHTLTFLAYEKGAAVISPQ